MSGPLPKEAPVLPPLPESVNETFKILENNPVVKDALKQIKEEEQLTMADQIALTEIEAPPFHEEVRAAYFAERLRELGLTNVRMIRGVENVAVIDSFVVDKANFLEAYKIHEESGKIGLNSLFFAASNCSLQAAISASGLSDSSLPLSRAAILFFKSLISPFVPPFFLLT